MSNVRLLTLLLVIGAGCESGGTGPPEVTEGGVTEGGVTEGGGQNIVILSEGLNLPGAIAVNSSRVYWIAGDGTLMSVPKGGGARDSVGTGCKPGALAIDGSHAYCGGNDGTVIALPLGGGAPTILASAQPVSDITVDGSRVYFTTYYGLRPAGNNDISVVAAVGLGGGALDVLATRQRVPSSLVVDGSSVYWLTLVDPATATGTTVMRVGLEGGTPVPLAMGSGRSPSIGASRNKTIAVDGTSVYWSEVEGTIRKAPLGGGAATVLAEAQDIPGAIALDQNYVYWANVTAIVKAPLAGGTPTQLAGEGAASIALDATHIYWTNSDKGTVATMPK